ncbi:hypothetical protein ACIBHX_47070 [Nonomuraea sp. NPDC050536]|uniref:hypothetical protein n=1 Tax=Nonomuraea sp. NPDC050536 TaxID=3364366 RepID=UPI0037C57590
MSPFQPYRVEASTTTGPREVLISEEAQNAADTAIWALILDREGVEGMKRLMIRNLTELSRLVGGLGSRHRAADLAKRVSRWNLDTGTHKRFANIRPCRSIMDIPQAGSCEWCGRQAGPGHYAHACYTQARDHLLAASRRSGERMSQEAVEMLYRLREAASIT